MRAIRASANEAFAERYVKIARRRGAQAKIDVAAVSGKGVLVHASDFPVDGLSQHDAGEEIAGYRHGVILTEYRWAAVNQGRTTVYEILAVRYFETERLKGRLPRVSSNDTKTTGSHPGHRRQFLTARDGILADQDRVIAEHEDKI